MSMQITALARRRLIVVSLMAVAVAACGGTGPTSSASGPSSYLIEPATVVDEGRDLVPGLYSVEAPFPLTFSFTSPRGFALWGYTASGSQLNINTGPAELSFEIVEHVNADPCTRGFDDPPMGPYVDDLVFALIKLERHGFEIGQVGATTVGGFPGKALTLTAPAEGSGDCDGFRTWRTSTRQNGMGPGEVADVRVVDVHGVRLLISIAHGPELRGTDREDLEAIIDSVQFEP